MRHQLTEGCMAPKFEVAAANDYELLEPDSLVEPDEEGNDMTILKPKFDDK